jgi:hypothetical protein
MMITSAPIKHARMLKKGNSETSSPDELRLLAISGGFCFHLPAIGGGSHEAAEASQ